MSVYDQENPEYLKAAIDSMFSQTYPTDDFVLICDGPLTAGLEAVISIFSRAHPETFHVVRLPRREGLAAALNAGLRHCRHELVARMDSDDISMPHRCETQLAYFRQHPEISVLSGTVLEFHSDPKTITGRRTPPSGYRNICRFSRKRSPFNHPAVMFRKSVVDAMGGYRGNYPFLEDYDLWVRILRAGFRGKNLREPVLFMRTGTELYRRRSGRRYALWLLRFHSGLLLRGWISGADLVLGSLPHALVCLMPLNLLRQVYSLLHR